MSGINLYLIIFLYGMVIATSFENGLVLFEKKNFEGELLKLQNLQTLENNINDCKNLPIIWQNKSSSIFTDACVILFSDLNCKISRSPQLFTNMKLKSNKNFVSYPSKIPYNDFFGTGLDRRVSSFRGCTVLEEFFAENKP